MKYCPSSWDPRYRPWYVNVVTGPKDIVIVLDVSGSMSTDPVAARNTKAIDAFDRLMMTLTERDYVGLVLFSDRAFVEGRPDFIPLLPSFVPRGQNAPFLKSPRAHRSAMWLRLRTI